MWPQLVARPLHRARRLLPTPKPRGHLDAERFDRLSPVAATLPPRRPDALTRASAAVDGKLEILGETISIDAIDWRRRYASHLWTFHLHYFDIARDLADAHRKTGDALYRETFRQLAMDWIRNTAGGRGEGWEAYPLATRIANWTIALLTIGDRGADMQPIFDSLLEQIVVLEQRLEWHLMGNHLQRNLTALIVGSLIFEGPSAYHTRRRSLARIWREVDSQVLADGVHAERSPMYHAIALGDVLEMITLLRAAREPVPHERVERIARMTRVFGALCRENGKLHQLHDAADGIAPTRDWIADVARRTLDAVPANPDGMWRLEDGGYAGFARAESGERFILDVGDPAPKHQPAHSHCSVLSFELDLDGEPVIVDSGVSGYEGDPFREYSRSTRAHNTVSIDGREQSEVWGTFRMARRAQVEFSRVTSDAGGVQFHAAYRPYHNRSCLHERRVQRTTDGVWTITDVVQGADAARLTSYIHLHASCRVAETPAGFAIHTGSRVLELTTLGARSATIVKGATDLRQGWLLESFGSATPAPVIVLETAASDGPFGYRLARAIVDRSA
jgi:uncharacterized heparinase superfamily protein